MLVNELARRTGCTPRMIRHYEARGLVESERRANGYRTFAESAVDQVIRIRTLLDAGLTVEDARPLLHCFSENNRPVACPALAAQVHRAIEDLEQQEARLSRARVSLMALLR